MKILTKLQQGLIISSSVKFQPSRKVAIKLLKLDLNLKFNSNLSQYIVKLQTSNKKQYIIICSCTSMIQAILYLAASTKQNQLIPIQEINGIYFNDCLVYKIKNSNLSELCFINSQKMTYYKSGLNQIRFTKIEKNQQRKISLIIQIILESIKLQEQQKDQNNQNQYSLKQEIKNNLNVLDHELAERLLEIIVDIYEYKNDQRNQLAVLEYLLEQYPQSTYGLVKLATIMLTQNKYSKCQKLVLRLPKQSLAGLEIKLKLLIVNEKQDIVKDECKYIIEKIQYSSLPKISSIPFHTILYEILLQQSNYVEARSQFQKMINIVKNQLNLNTKDQFQYYSLKKQLVAMVLYHCQFLIKQGQLSTSICLLQQVLQINMFSKQQQQNDIENKIIEIENKQNLSIKILENIDKNKASQYQRFIRDQLKEDIRIEFLNSIRKQNKLEKVDNNSLRFLELELIENFIKLQLKQQIDIKSIEQYINTQYHFETQNVKNTFTLLLFLETQNIQKKKILMKKLLREFPTMSAYYLQIFDKLQNKTEITEKNNMIIKQFQSKGLTMRALEMSYQLQVHSKTLEEKYDNKNIYYNQNLVKINRNRLFNLQSIFQLNTSSSKLDYQKSQHSSSDLNINNSQQLYQKLVISSNQKGSVHPFTLQLSFALAKQYYFQSKYFQCLVYFIHYMSFVQTNNSMQNQIKDALQKVMQMSQQQINQTQQLSFQNSWQLKIVSLLRKTYYSDDKQKQSFKQSIFLQEQL